jgi:periplasmic protein TonB
MTNSATYEELSIRRYIGYSAWLHIAIGLALLAGIYLNVPGNNWGGIGGGSTGSVKVSLVASSGIPMPQPTVPTTSEAVDPTKGLHKEDPKPKEESKTDSTPLQKFEKNKPLPKSKESKVFENKQPQQDNAINYGKGGQMSVPTGYADSPGAYSSGVAMQGPGGGDFATRYGWYVESVRRAISQNWIQTTIDPATRAARRAHSVVAFRIYRNGTIGNIKLDTSSGNRSMDDSATRALLSIDKFPALPSDYSGAYVDVTFDFDLSLIK